MVSPLLSKPTRLQRVLLYAAIVVGIIVAVVDVAWFSAAYESPWPRAGARLDLAPIALALETYRLDHRAYPPDTGYFIHRNEWRSRFDPASLWRYLVRPVYDPTRDRTMGPYLNLGGELSSAGYEIVVDPWGNPIDFRAEPGRVLHNRGRFDLYSCGPDGVTAGNNGADDDGDGRVDEPDEWKLNGTLGDDINNW